MDKSGDEKMSPGALHKKLKQTRLPFQVLSPAVKVTKIESRKRKPSATEDQAPAAKIGRISEVKENVIKTGETIEVLDDDSSSAIPEDTIQEKAANSAKSSKSFGKSKKEEVVAKKIRKCLDSSTKQEDDGKIHIKLPISKKNKKKDDADQKDSKKKKNKSKKSNKEVKKALEKVDSAADSEIIPLDDSDLSDDEYDKTTKTLGDDIDEELLSGKEENDEEIETSCQIPDIQDEENAKSLVEKSPVKEDLVKKSPEKSEKLSKKAKKSSDTLEKDEKSAEQYGKSSMKTSEKSEKSPKDKKSSKKADEKLPEKTEKTEKSSTDEESLEKDAESDQQVEKSPEKDEKSPPKAINSPTEKKSPENDEEISDKIQIEDDSNNGRKKTGKRPIKTSPENQGKRKSLRVGQQSVNEKKSAEVAEEKKEKKSEVPQRKEEQKVVKGKLDMFFKKKAPENEKSSEKVEKSEKCPENDKSPEQVENSPEKAAKSTEKAENSSEEAAESPEQPIEIDGDEDELDVENSALKETKAEKTPEKKKKCSSPKSTEKMEKQADDSLNSSGNSSKKSTEKMEIEEVEDLNASTSHQNHNDTIKSLNFDDSCNEDDIYLLCTPNSKLVSEATAKKLTPKQMARKKEFEMKALQKQKEKEERKKKIQDEKEARQKEKEEQERLKKKEREEKEEQKRKEREEKEEQKRKEREDKEEQRKKEKEERDRKKQAEIDQKNEEKRMKEQQKEDERKKKEEEKAALENKMKKQTAVFSKFFVKKKSDLKASDDENSVENTEALKFMPFRVKYDMRVAPTVRKTISEDRKNALVNFLETCQEVERNDLYLKEIHKQGYEAGKCGKTWIPEEEDTEEVMIIDDLGQEIEDDPDKAKQKFRAKFFLFEENRRPPFRGTWRKKSSAISATKPFALDTKFFDYEVDSDDEWEEEEPGESLHGSDDEKDVDPEEDYEVDNDFFVPHGHLSDEEIQEEGEVMEDNTPETQKAKLKILQQEFAAEMKKKTEKIKPRLIGCIWENNNNEGESELPCTAVIWELLKSRSMMLDTSVPITIEKLTVVEKPEVTTTTSAPAKIKIPESEVPDLIRLVHGNTHSRKFLVKEFQAFRAKKYKDDPNYIECTMESIATKIKVVAEWTPCSEAEKKCWYCTEETLTKYEVEDAKIPNTWSYNLAVAPDKRMKKKKEQNVSDTSSSPKDLKSQSNNSDDVKLVLTKSKPSSSFNITKFTKVLSEDEKKKQFVPKEEKLSTPQKPKQEPVTSTTKTTPASSQSQPKKRVQLLMSVPRGQKIPETKKNNLISQFLKAKTDEKSSVNSSSAEAAPMEVEEIIVLD